MKKTAFTLVEMIAVMAVLGVLVMIILPVMRNVLIDFEQKSNKQIYEQLYKSAKLYYVEKRTSTNLSERLTWYAPFVNSTPQGGEPALPARADMYEKTWADADPDYFSENLAWACILTDKMVAEGYLKQINLDDIKERLEITVPLYVVMMGEVQNGNARSFRLTDNALIIKDDLKWDSANCQN